MFHQLWTILSGSIAFLSDLLATVIGVASIYAFFRYRGRVVGLIRFLRLSHLNDRAVELRETMDLILSCGIAKGRSAELRALFARLNGQLLPLCTIYEELRVLQEQIEDVALRNGRLNESVRQQVVHQLRSQIETMKYVSLTEAVGQKK